MVPRETALIETQHCSFLDSLPNSEPKDMVFLIRRVALTLAHFPPSGKGRIWATNEHGSIQVIRKSRITTDKVRYSQPPENKDQ